MSWYRAGTVSCTQNSTTVTGAGTGFAANSRVGDALLGPDGNWYELANVASDTVISILPAYRGPNVAGGEFAIVPVQGYQKALADRARELLDSVGGIATSPALAAMAQLAPVADQLAYFSDVDEMELISFNSVARNLVAAQTQAAQRTALGLKGAAVLDANAFAETFLKAATKVAQRTAMDIKSAALLDADAFAQTLLNAANVGAQRTALGLGSAALAAILGTVSQSGGTPNGAIYERGSTANGAYVKYADGTAVCIKQLAVTIPVTNGYGAMFASALQTGGAMPISMARVDDCKVQVAGADGACITTLTTAPTLSLYPNWLLLNPTSASRTITAYIRVEGVWFA